MQATPFFPKAGNRRRTIDPHHYRILLGLIAALEEVEEEVPSIVLGARHVQVATIVSSGALSRLLWFHVSMGADSQLA